jgi:hypothetical protein
MLKGIFGSLKAEVTGVKLHNEELYNLHSSLSTIKGNVWGGEFGTHWKKEKCIRNF